MKRFISLLVLSLSAASCVAYYIKPPITLCMKEDFSGCLDIAYPSNCVDLNNVTLNSNYGVTKYYSINNTVESVIVSDVENMTDRCVVLFDTYACQGKSLVLQAPTLPSVNLYKYKFANLARSIRPCTAKLLKWLKEHPYEEIASNAVPVSEHNMLPANNLPGENE